MFPSVMVYSEASVVWVVVGFFQTKEQTLVVSGVWGFLDEPGFLPLILVVSL